MELTWEIPFPHTRKMFLPVQGSVYMHKTTGDTASERLGTMELHGEVISSAGSQSTDSQNRRQ